MNPVSSGNRADCFPFRSVLNGILLLLAVTASAAAQFDLTVNMTEFAPTHEGQLFKLRVVNRNTGQELAEFELESIVTADFTASFNNILKSGENYNIDAFADFSDNNLYDPPPEDHAWRITLLAVTADTTITLRHTGKWTDIQYPNPGTEPEPEPEPEPEDTCDCDLNGDGISDTGDLLEWIVQVRGGGGGADNPCLDYDKDGRLAVSDLVRLLIHIRAGGCMRP